MLQHRFATADMLGKQMADLAGIRRIFEGHTYLSTGSYTIRLHQLLSLF